MIIRLSLALLLLTIVALTITANTVNAQIIITVLPEPEIEEDEEDNGGNGGEPFEEVEEEIGEEEEVGEEEEESVELEIITKGCADGLGYHKDGPYLCYPLDSIGEEPPEGMAFCAALSCPYNPPDLS